ncbi:MAG TPA: glycosyltransferase [Nostocaceae cyanobacterium]|nr:glycosyltransferase [Nostocaceae cyanobacterium]
MSKIPKIIHQIFFSGKAAIPDNYLRYHQTVLKKHPLWEHQFWDEARARKFMSENYAWFLPTFDAYPYDIQRRDAIRYFILYHYGGFYLDMDVECLKPLDDLLEDFELVLSKLVNFSNAIMGSVPGHPLWPQVFTELEKRKDPPQKTNNFLQNSMPYYVGYSTGPMLLHDCVVAGKFDQIDSVRSCPGYIFEPGAPMEENGKIYKSKITSKSYTIHHMTTSWLDKRNKIIRFLFGLITEPYWFFRSLQKG